MRPLRRRLLWTALGLGGGTAALGASLVSVLAPPLQRRDGLRADGREGPAPGDADAPGPGTEICIVAPPEPWDAASGIARDAPRTPSARSRCPVCGMFVARHPRWAAQVLHRDGQAQFFDSPLHLLLFLQEPARWRPGWQAADLPGRWLADHEDGHWVPLAQAHLVEGSRTPGPMRTPDLPAFADARRAGRHAAQEGGQVRPARVLLQALPPALQALGPHRH
ncbi:MAG: hypothetical protein RIQ53_1721 [Pseudomonadota bacterium]|jgi:nitrous oxide reductase accessory protein NosL